MSRPSLLAVVFMLGLHQAAPPNEGALDTALEDLARTAEARLGIGPREQEAAEAVGSFGAAAIPGLLRLLQHDREAVRVLAAYTVRDVDGLGEVHLDALIEAQLRDDSWLPPAIARIGTPRALEFLRSELAKYPNRHTQHTYAWGLLGDKGVPYLIEPYECENDCDDELLDVIAFILEGLGDSAATAIPRLLSVATDSTRSQLARRASVEAIGAIGPVAEPVVGELRRLAHDEPDVFELVVKDAVAGIGGPAAAAILLARLADEPDAVHFRDLAELGRGARGAGPHLLQYLTHEDWNVRVWAARTLGYIEYDAAAGELAEVLFFENDERDWVLTAVSMESLARLEARGMAPLIEFVRDEHWYPPVRNAAARALDVLERRATYESAFGPNSFPQEFFSYTSIGEEIDACESESRRNRLSQANAAQLEYTVDIVSYGEHGRQTTVTRQKPDVGIPLKDGWLVGSDRGEWGGELVYLDTAFEPQVILEENVIGVFAMRSNIAVVTKVSHLNRGMAYRVSTSSDGRIMASEWVALPGTPHAAIMSDGVLLVHGSGGSVLVYADGELEMADCDG